VPLARRISPYRRLAEVTGLAVIAVLLFRALIAEPYGVPTGSMAPTLLGNHKETVCPRCGYPIAVGQHEQGKSGGPDTAVCPNCGCADIRLDECPTVAGDHLLVNKTVFDWRRPRRWEMVVFRCPADRDRSFVKRVVGLPGESVELRGGDVFIDHELVRKSLAEFKALRIPVCDYRYVPRPGGWQSRWQVRAGGRSWANDDHLTLETAADAASFGWLIYHNGPGDGREDRPITDEYAYNGPSGQPEPVHDFDMECDLDVLQGDGWLALAISDGRDDLVAELPVGRSREGVRLRDADPIGGRRAGGSLAPAERQTYRTAPGFTLAAGKSYHVELAFVDRRLTLTVDGVSPFPPVDRRVVPERSGVTSPVRLGARGVDVTIRNFLLFRDIQYTAAGRHAVRAPVRLGAGEYFVLGDNSPNSDDSRFWSDPDGRPLPVSQADLLGKPFLVHLPSRAVHSEALGGRWDYQGPDWGRIRWLR
jgi:signal peptidase I